MAAEIIPFRKPDPQTGPLDYAPGVAPFDRTNPHHIEAWNTIWALGKSRVGREERYGKED